MAFNINNFRANLRFGGARTSLFEVKITNPVNAAADIAVPLLCKAAALPASNITPLEVFHFGRAIKLAGNRTFEDWNVTIINDEDFKIRNALEQWSNAINSYQGNIRTLPSSESSFYKSTAEVVQYSKTGEQLRTYKFIGIFPTAVSQIDLDWGNEAIQEYPVTFAVDEFYVEDSSPTGNAGGR